MQNIRLIFILFTAFFSTLSLFSQERESLNNNLDSEGELLIDFVEINNKRETTLMDLSDYIDLVYSDASKFLKPEDLKVDLGFNNWEVVLSPSARVKYYVENSYVSAATVNSNSKRYPGQTLMGVRVAFPEGGKATALLKPPFPMPFFAGADTRQFISKGVIDNVGQIKELKLTLYSLGADAHLELVLEDISEREYTFPLGNLKTKGWRDLIWKNPYYLEKLSGRVIKKDYPLYPLEESYMRFKALRIFKPSSLKSVNVIFYLKDIRVLYDKLNIESEADIESEQIWRINEERTKKSLEQFKKREALRRILKLREGLSMPEGTFK